MKEMTITAAIQEAIAEEMRADDKVMMIGQDIRGAIFPHTRGLVQEFGEDRIVDTPVAEAGMFGTAFGAAQEGFRPIVDFMFGGFSYQAFAECAVTAGSYYFLHGSQHPLPLVMTCAMATGMRLANDHAMSIHGAFCHHPGIKVAMPSTPYDAKGLFKSAIRDDNPVLVPWHLGQARETGQVPEEEYLVPLGSADVKLEGDGVTVLAIGRQVQNALRAAEDLAEEVSVEVVDARSLVPFDMDTLLRSLGKTNRLVVVDEDWESGSFASTIAARVAEQAFDLLRAPIVRVTIPNMPIPGGYMEAAVLPTPEKIVAAVKTVLG